MYVMVLNDGTDEIFNLNGEEGDCWSEIILNRLLNIGGPETTLEDAARITLAEGYLLCHDREEFEYYQAGNTDEEDMNLDEDDFRPLEQVAPKIAALLNTYLTTDYRRQKDGN